MGKLNKYNSLLIYTAILIIVFYLIPFLFKGGIASLFLINPLTVLICSIIYGKNYSFNLLTVLITAVLFFPTIYIFYNESAWIYVIFYLIVSLVGNFIGCMLYRRNK